MGLSLGKGAGMTTVVKVCRRRCPEFIASLGLIFLISVAFLPAAQAQLPECGTTLPTGEPAGGKVQGPATIDPVELGRSQDGARELELEFLFSECRPPKNVKVAFGIFRSGKQDLPIGAVTQKALEVDDTIVRLTLSVARDKVPTGSFTGVARLGGNGVPEAQAQVSIKRQYGVLPWPLVIGILSAIAGIGLAGIRRLYEKPDTTKSTTNIENASKKIHKIGWGLLRPFEWIWIGISKVFNKARQKENAWPVLLGFGSGSAVWLTAYLEDSTWSFDMGSAISLATKVGAAALEKYPPSLLRGDEYFLPELKKAFARVSPADSADPRHRVDLTLTTTLLTGEWTQFDDDYGSVVGDQSYLGLFRFRNDVVWKDFAQPGTADRLALAARTSASFPGAFEASSIYVGKSSAYPPDAITFPEHVVNFKTARFGIDGGALMNSPIQPVLESIAEQPPGPLVRRVLAYVTPSPSDGPDQVGPNSGTDGRLPSPPTLAATLTSALMLPRVETIGRDLKDLREYNRVAAIARQMREDITSFSPDLDGGGSLPETLFQHYRSMRINTSIEYILDEIALGIRSNAASSWNRSKLRAAFRVMARTESEEGDLGLPWVPTTLPASGADIPPAEDWNWGLEPVEQAAFLVADLLRQVLSLPTDPNGTLGETEQRASVIDARKSVADAMAGLREVRAKDRNHWREDVSGTIQQLQQNEEADTKYLETLVKRATDTAAGITPEEVLVTKTVVRNHGLSIARALANASAAARLIVAGATTPELKLRNAIEALVPSDDSQATDDSNVLARLLRLVVVHGALGLSALGPGLSVKLLELSADTPNGYDNRLKSTEKLAGNQLNHFGAFYKSSWRANDWMWGRLDAAMRLTQMLLDPLRIRQVSRGDTAERWEGRLRTIAGTTVDPENNRAWRPLTVQTELSFIDDNDTVPASIPFTAGSIARRIQLEILREELPNIAEAAEADMQSGAERLETAVDFLAKAAKLKTDDSPNAIAEALMACRVGEEKLEGEFRSKLFASTLSTAGSVTMSAVTGSAAGVPLGPIGPLIRGAWKFRRPLAFVGRRFPRVRRFLDRFRRKQPR